MPRETGGASPPPPPPEGVPAVRVGIGYDSHRYAPRRPLTLGGVLIPSEFGLEGHSDADALCHAVTDAILGAAGLGDIGEMFPDTAAVNKDRDSIEMLQAAVHRASGAGYDVGQID